MSINWRKRLERRRWSRPELTLDDLTPELMAKIIGGPPPSVVYHFGAVDTESFTYTQREALREALGYE